MKYHTFKAQLAERIAAETGGNCRILIQEIPGNNGIRKESMTVIESEGQAVPAICLEPYFQAYQAGMPIADLAERFLEEFHRNQIPGKQDMESFLEYEKAAGNICYRVVNYEKNKDQLQNMPHRKILDLALIYYYRMEHFMEHTASVLIFDDHMKRWSVTEQQLYERAKKNTCLALPPKLAGILQVIQELDENSDWIKDDMEFCENERMYVLTNQEKYFGAVCILYPGVAQSIAESFSNNFYILPSSIHECIIVPDSGQLIPQELKELVQDVNCQCVEEEEILSDHIYYYDRRQHKIRLVQTEEELFL